MRPKSCVLTRFGPPPDAPSSTIVPPRARSTPTRIVPLSSALRRSGRRFALAARRRGLALRRGELDLAQADALRRHLDALVVADQLERLLERERPRRNEAHRLVGARGAHVRELLLLRRVHVEILG